MLIAAEGRGLSIVPLKEQPAALLAMLRPAFSLESFSARLGEANARALVEQLLAQSLLVDAGARPETGSAQERQYGYFGAFSFDPAFAQERLSSSRVAVIGLGGVGSVVLQQLVMAGVRRFVLVDGDSVARDNLNRQVVYGPRHVGAPKVEAAAEFVESIEPSSEIRTVPAFVKCEEDLALLDAADPTFVVLAADNPMREIGGWVDRHCRARDIPFSSAGLGIRSGFWGPLVVPGKTPCLECLERELGERLTDAEEALASVVIRPTAYSLGASNAAISSLLARDCIHWLAGLTAIPSLGRRLVWDFETATTSVYSAASCPHVE